MNSEYLIAKSGTPPLSNRSVNNKALWTEWAQQQTATLSLQSREELDVSLYSSARHESLPHETYVREEKQQPSPYGENNERERERGSSENHYLTLIWCWLSSFLPPTLTQGNDGLSVLMQQQYTGEKGTVLLALGWYCNGGVCCSLPFTSSTTTAPPLHYCCSLHLLKLTRPSWHTGQSYECRSIEGFQFLAKGN